MLRLTALKGGIAALVLGALLQIGVGSWFAPTKVHTAYYETGELLLECPLDRDGELHGELKMYEKDGSLQSVQQYAHGRIGRVIMRPLRD